MVWAVPQNTIQEINAAGRVLVAGYDMDELFSEKFDQWIRAYEILNNWRASHSYPLNTFQVNLRRSARRFDPNALVAQRIKRLVSITNKLSRLPNMKLSQMQDIGGCRAVMENVTNVHDLVRYYDAESRIKHVRATKDDYITNPQRSGYRGMHLVYRYFSDKKSTQIYNNLKIEMQIRSQFQHAWATAVETVGTFVGQALKSSIGDIEWRRFFALMSTAIAMRENTACVPETPTNSRELHDELKGYAKQLNVQSRLNAYGEALRSLTQRAEKAHYYLLELDTRESRLSVTGYRMNEMPQAEKKYQEAEKIARNSTSMDAVLVSVESLSALQRAYPNYFADTRMFVELLHQELTGHQHDIDVPAMNLTEVK